MKVLFCTDGSKISYNSLRNFKKWACEAVVDTICVIDWSFIPDEVNIEIEDFTMSCDNIADNILNYTEKEIEKLGLRQGEKIKHCGAVVDTILEQQSKVEYDFVLMGSHGKKGFQKWLGSVSQDIISNGKTSVYISKNENAGQKILLTTDGSDCAFEGTKKIVSDFNLKEKEIYICMVNESPDLLFLEGTLDANWLLSIEEEQEEYAGRAIMKLNDLLKEHNLETKETSILSGNPTSEILDYTKNMEIDLIVMSTKERTKLEKFLLSSVSKRVLDNAQCDVVIIK